MANYTLFLSPWPNYSPRMARLKKSGKRSARTTGHPLSASTGEDAGVRCRCPRPSIQLFYSALKHGEAGFVMANSASNARASEQELRRQLIESRAVDVMVAVTLPFRL